jgi:hypothetical protein
LKKRREKKGRVGGRKERGMKKILQAGNTGRENFLEANFLQDGYPVISIFSS